MSKLYSSMYRELIAHNKLRVGGIARETLRTKISAAKAAHEREMRNLGYTPEPCYIKIEKVLTDNDEEVYDVSLHKGATAFGVNKRKVSWSPVAVGVDDTCGGSSDA